MCEWHESPEPKLLQRLLESKTPEARAYAAGTLARWADRLPPEFDAIEKLADLAHDEDPRRCASARSSRQATSSVRSPSVVES